MRLCYPICAPIAYALIKLLGEEAAQVYTKKDILSIVVDETDPEKGDIDTDEQRLVKGSLSFSAKKVQDVMTPNTVVTTVEIDDTIDDEYLAKLKEIHYSRIPVQTEDPNNIIGILYYKDLVGVELPVRVKDIMDSTVHFVNASDSLDAVLNQFIKTKMHLFIVIDDFGGFEGVITLEDVIEEIIGKEIMDEGDEVADLREVALQKKEAIRELSRKNDYLLGL
jgi:metal transporter CNNM